MPTAPTNPTAPVAHGEKTASIAFQTEQARQALAKAPAEQRGADTRESLDNPYENLACTD
jgi:hypothetical protein